MYSKTSEHIWQRRRVIWLFSGCAMIAVILIIGGLTRLNQAGLSITEWEVVRGVIPPLTTAHWEEVFETYRQYPEYREIHHGMSLAEFKVIYWWEYSHRMLSRLLGLLFLIPFLWFVWKRAMPLGDAAKLIGIMILGGIQAFLGWYLVQSGLEDHPVVSHLRLGIHLFVAFMIFAFLWTMALNRLPSRLRIWRQAGRTSAPGFTSFLFGFGNFFTGVRTVHSRPSFTAGRVHRTGSDLLSFVFGVIVVLIFLQILVGGWTAGLKAGFVYPTFPKMGDYWIPPELGFMSPWWYDFTHNAISVQFLHRALALMVALLILIPVITGMRFGFRPLHLAGWILLAIIVLQILTGAGSLLWGVPTWIASVHQFGALVLLAGVLYWWNTYKWWRYQLS